MQAKYHTFTTALRYGVRPGRKRFSVDAVLDDEATTAALVEILAGSAEATRRRQRP